jgi:[ribosomal protein S5]-alanine N-acetyltransferase
MSKAELGYELLASYQRKGIMTEAITAVLDFAFTQLALSKIEAWTHPQNERSSALLHKVNFRRDPDAEEAKPKDAKEFIYVLQAKDH